jgi:hypothetical protein
MKTSASSVVSMGLGRTTVEVLMQTKLANSPSERYVVEIDGVAKLEYSVFVKALTASLQLRQEFPHNSVKLRDAEEKAPLHA